MKQREIISIYALGLHSYSLLWFIILVINIIETKIIKRKRNHETI